MSIHEGGYGHAVRLEDIIVDDFHMNAHETITAHAVKVYLAGLTDKQALGTLDLILKPWEREEVPEDEESTGISRADVDTDQLEELVCKSLQTFQMQIKEDLVEDQLPFRAAATWEAAWKVAEAVKPDAFVQEVSNDFLAFISECHTVVQRRKA